MSISEKTSYITLYVPFSILPKVRCVAINCRWFSRSFSPNYVLCHLYLPHTIYLCTMYLLKLQKKIRIQFCRYSSYRNIPRPFRYRYPWHCQPCWCRLYVEIIFFVRHLLIPLRYQINFIFCVQRISQCFHEAPIENIVINVPVVERYAYPRVRSVRWALCQCSEKRIISIVIEGEIALRWGGGSAPSRQVSGITFQRVAGRLLV